MSTPNAIIPATGDKIKDETDYAGTGPHPLSFTRSYSSNRAKRLGTTPAGSTPDPLWHHNHEPRLQLSVPNITIVFGNGNLRTFSSPNPASSGIITTSAWPSTIGQGNLIPQPDAAVPPNPALTTWLYTNPEDDSTWLFNAAGQPIKHTQRNSWAMTYAYNSSGQLASVTNAFGRSLAFAYNAAGQLSSVTPPDGLAINYSYDSQGRLASTTYPANAGASATSKTYLYEDTNPALLTGIADESGQRSTYAYDPQGMAISSALPGGMQRYQVSYSAAGKAQVTDPLGTQRSYDYSIAQGKLAVTAANLPGESGQSDAASRVQDTNGFVTKETDFLGVQTMYTWDATRRLPLSTTQAAGRPEAQTTQTQWHPTFRLPTLLTEQGRTTAYTYDAKGNKLSETITDTATGQARTWAWTYNPAGLVATSTDPLGRITSYAYNAQGNATSMTNPLGHVSTYSYDIAGRLSVQTEPNGLTTRYSYDARGRLLTSIVGTGAAQETTAYTYHPTGQLATAALPGGLQLAYTYDAAQRLTAATDNRGNRISYTLDPMGNRVREETRDQSNTLALATGRVINSLNRIAAIQGAQGQTTATAYDANGQATSQTDPANQTTRQTLDGLRRPVATTFADNTQASQAFNALDQLTQVTDPKGVATSYSRNAFGEVMVETSPDIGSISYQRNAAGEVISSLDAKGNTTSITRDALGRPITVTRGSNPNTPHISTYTWDTGSTGSQIGYLAKLQDPSGTTSYVRDSFGRITSKTQTINDNPSAPSTYTTRYSYAKGDLASITYPSGLKALYTRSPSGQVTAISTQVPGFNKPVTPFASNITYTALGQPKAWSWVSGDAASRAFDTDGRMTGNEFAAYTFDAASRITGITQNVWASRTVTQVIGTGTAVVTQLYPTPLTWQAAYDSRNRIVGFNRPGAQTRYTYDANSNRLTSIDKTTSDTNASGGFELADTALTTNQALNIQTGSNRLLGFTQTLTRVQGTRTLATTNSQINYALDAKGNLTSDGLRSFEYDEANRLAKVKILKDGEAASIKYFTNGLGQQVFKSEPKPDQYLPNQSQLGTGFIAWLKTNFGWLYAQAQTDASLGSAYMYADGQLPSWAVLGEYDNGSASGTGRTEYIWLPTEDGGAIPVGMFRSSKFFAIHSDHLGTPRLMTDNTNKAVWQWPYSAFGNNKPTGILKPTTSATWAFTNQPVLLGTQNPAAVLDLRFPGQMADVETGLFYNYFRTYQPNQGRYTQNDPIGLQGGLNRFAYVEGNPLMYTDPKGESITTTGAIIIGGIVYGGYKIYDKFRKFDGDVKACLMQCENTVACGDPERTALLQDNVSRCKASCNGYSALSDLFGVGKGPTGPKAPTSTPPIFKP